MQREFQILEYSLNKGNGGLSIVESREVANALDAIAKAFNDLVEENKALKEKVLGESPVPQKRDAKPRD